VRREDLVKIIPKVEGIVCFGKDGINAELLQHAKKLKVIANYGAGYDAIDVTTATKQGRIRLKILNDLGIWVCNTPSVVSEATSNYLASSIFLCLRIFQLTFLSR
jgi:glyoxylate reductase